jgi:hypothetical protein
MLEAIVTNVSKTSVICVMLLVLVLIACVIAAIAIAQICESQHTVRGGAGAQVCLKPTKKDMRDIPIGKPIILDGNNIVHAYAKWRKIPVYDTSFYIILNTLSRKLVDKFPHNPIHIVTKTRDVEVARAKKTKGRARKRVGTRVDASITADPKVHTSLSDHISMITAISNSDGAGITYHIAYSDAVATTAHHYLGSRDDFLTILLANTTDGIVVSFDQFRDSEDFDKIPLFTHYTIHNGVTSDIVVDPAQTKVVYGPKVHQNHYKLGFAAKSTCQQAACYDKVICDHCIYLSID